jgi:hypothetical protein
VTVNRNSKSIATQTNITDTIGLANENNSFYSREEGLAVVDERLNPETDSLVSEISMA